MRIGSITGRILLWTTKSAISDLPENLGRPILRLLLRNNGLGQAFFARLEQKYRNAKARSVPVACPPDRTL